MSIASCGCCCCGCDGVDNALVAHTLAGGCPTFLRQGGKVDQIRLGDAERCVLSNVVAEWCTTTHCHSLCHGQVSTACHETIDVKKNQFIQEEEEDTASEALRICVLTSMSQE